MSVETACQHFIFPDSEPIHNYVVPGLTSHLLSDYKVRLFESDRQLQLGDIAPHSHRYDFLCCVLKGEVHNTVWIPDPHGDFFTLSRLTYSGEPGKYTKVVADEPTRYAPVTTTYMPGDWYEMQWCDIHSIRFDKQALVLFLEGPSERDFSLMLEPHVRRTRIPMGDVQPWMFSKE